MHILIIPSWYPENVGDVAGCFFREQAQALRKQGCKVGVITLYLRSRGWRSVLTGRYDLAYEDDQGVFTYRKYDVRWSTLILPWLWRRRSLKLFEHYIKKMAGLMLFTFIQCSMLALQLKPLQISIRFPISLPNTVQLLHVDW